MFPNYIHSQDVQIYPLSFAPCVTCAFVPPCTRPNTQPHIQYTDVLVSRRINFYYNYSPFWIRVLWKAVPSTPFSHFSWHYQSSLSRCARLFPNICNFSLPELIDPLLYNLAGPSPGPRKPTALHLQI
jgi:hypothetical protein